MKASSRCREAVGVNSDGEYAAIRTASLQDAQESNIAT